MRTSKLILAATTVASNVALWTSYAAMKPDVRSDFGNVPNQLRGYLLIGAAVSFLCLLAFVGVLLTRENDSNVKLIFVSINLVVYYALQMAFLPLVRASTQGGASKWVVRWLLLACVVPITAVAAIGVEARDARLSLFGLTAAAHTFVNDAMLYGFLF
jgi:hypothetical protein